ncbi:hypothetical protein NEMBOFW57_009802 [Staphylotrichum longicolle]|uniref:2EXR domain-containing protein n=1 Tax=Staphylotrichum longicolle TaxID=669026 RepID=A0AAD4HVR7_9PEZI|nr:hypothetical protein NEMBOFW57_009802 [Staphylotrichum longicolle]
MFRSWYDQQDEKTEFWLEFQVMHDGLELAPDNDDNTSTTTNNNAKFTLFAALPTELRLKIWECLIQPRIVIAACLDSRFQDEKRAQLARRPKRPPVPVLLHVNHESRALALRHYEPAFAWKIPHRLLGPDTGVLPASRDARVWFNFRRDALFLLGELEPYDQHGFNSPMVYFLRRADTTRVRHVACAFEELHLSLYEADQVFGSLFHVIDMFPAARRLLITTTPRDAETRHLVLPAAENVVQKLWSAFMNETTCVTASLVERQILMIGEADLAGFVAAHND